MKIEHTDNSGFMYGTPAAVSHETGTLYINDPLYNQLTPFQQEFVKQHEIGHYRKHTHNEFEADRYAFNRMAGKYKKSLKQSIGTLETILDGDELEHQQRIQAMYELALQWDAEHGNTAAANELMRISNLNRVSRADGNKKATNTATGSTVTDQSKYNTELIEAIAALNVSQRQAEASDDNSNTMLILLAVVAILMIFK